MIMGFTLVPNISNMFEAAYEALILITLRWAEALRGAHEATW